MIRKVNIGRGSSDWVHTEGEFGREFGSGYSEGEIRKAIYGRLPGGVNRKVKFGRENSEGEIQIGWGGSFPSPKINFFTFETKWIHKGEFQSICGEYFAIHLGEFTSFQLEISLFSDEGLGTRSCSFYFMDFGRILNGI